MKPLLLLLITSVCYGQSDTSKFDMRQRCMVISQTDSPTVDYAIILYMDSGKLSCQPKDLKIIGDTVRAFREMSERLGEIVKMESVIDVFHRMYEGHLKFYGRGTK